MKENCPVCGQDNETAAAAAGAMKAAIMDSMMLSLTNIVEQADALIVQLARLKGAIK